MRAAFLVIAATTLGTMVPANAQQANNDYYANRGTILLQTVERYHLGIGEQELNAKRYNAAYADFKFILNYFPNHPQVLLLMGQTCERWKSPLCNADEFFERGIARKPDAAPTYVVYGIHLLRIGKQTEAIEILNRALSLDPNSMNAHYNIALAYLDVKQYDLANEHAQKAYALGATLSGLRDRLQRASQWRPDKLSVDKSVGGEARSQP